MPPHGFSVSEAERPVGVVRARDVRRVPREEWPSTPIRHIAVPIEQLPRIEASDDAYGVMRRMTQDAVDELSVIDRGQLSGIVRREDIARFIELQITAGAGASRRDKRWARV